MGYPNKYWDNVYFCICSSAMHPNTRYCTMCTEKKEGTKGRGGAGVTDTCFLTKSLWQIGLKHSQHHKAVADMVLQSNAASSQFPHPFGLFLENKLLESKTKFQIIICWIAPGLLTGFWGAGPAQFSQNDKIETSLLKEKTSKYCTMLKWYVWNLHKDLFYY